MWTTGSAPAVDLLGQLLDEPLEDDPPELEPPDDDPPADEEEDDDEDEEVLADELPLSPEEELDELVSLGVLDVDDVFESRLSVR